MVTPDQLSKALRYVRSIRNTAKQGYAYKCLYALQAGDALPDERGTLSVMGAQAVRINLNKILTPTTLTGERN